MFFQGAGVAPSVLATHQKLLKTDREAFKKHNVTREILKKLNQMGDAALAQRREILKRVTQFEDFSVCWESDRAPARGLVAQIRELVNEKDSFTRMNLERERERRERLEQKKVQDAAIEKRKAEFARAKSQFFSLFGEKDAHKRGKALEGALNSLFAVEGILIREAFSIKGKCGEGVIEQIDGLIEIDGQLYLVEAKWWNTTLGPKEVSPHLVRVYGRGGVAYGLFITYTDLTAASARYLQRRYASGPRYRRGEATGDRGTARRRRRY
ncbi:MAG: hypothetical protein QOF72_1607 [Blastocatellia bacterium]|nr:hypothetical protein [Blastocatellia bacterium]